MPDTTPRLTWERVGPYGRRSGDYYIAHVVSSGDDRFVLSFQQQRLGDYGTHAAAIAAAEAHASGEGNE